MESDEQGSRISGAAETANIGKLQLTLPPPCHQSQSSSNSRANKVFVLANVPALLTLPAEDRVLQYMRKMNRPFGAVDVAANLKGAIPKTAVQKILVSLAEKGEVIQKTYGKTTFFVYNQAKIDALPGDAIADLKTELSTIEDENKSLGSEVKSLSAELVKLRSAPTNDALDSQLAETRAAIKKLTDTLEPLRAGAPPISADEREQIQLGWTQWRAEWVRRRKVFITFWQLVTDALPPQDAKTLEEDLGLELDTPEHIALEKSLPCQNPLKRKRA